MSNPAPNGEDEWGASLLNLSELVIAVLDAAGAQSVAEVGAYEGELTELLLDWASRGESATGAEERWVAAIEPKPPAQLRELAAGRPELRLVESPSHQALEEIPMPDAVILDGDHNYFTVSGELAILDRRTSWVDGPLVLLHDVCWPHARRDTYYDPDRVPSDQRPEIAKEVGLVPWDRGTVPTGLPYPWAARQEGGPGNGVLTSVEDFVGGRKGLRLAIVPAFFGFGVLWHEAAPWADAVAKVVEPWDRNPILAHLEENRVYHLAKEHQYDSHRRSLRERVEIQEDVLQLMLRSRAFAIGEWISRMRKGGRPVFSRELVRRAMGDRDPR